jgi:hypothetical protein
VFQIVIILKIYSGIASGEQDFIEREREREGGGREGVGGLTG